MAEAEAINALRDAKRRLDLSGDKRHIAKAIGIARNVDPPMSDAVIAAELGVPVEWVGEHARWENLDLVRSIYADWERGDWSSAWWAHPDIEYVMVDEPGSATHSGLAPMADSWRAFLNAWVDYRLEALEYRTLDEERVLVLVRAHGTGKGSGVELSELTERSGRHVGANLFRIRDGRVVRLDAYFDCDRAFADLGLKG